MAKRSPTGAFGWDTQIESEARVSCAFQDTCLPWLALVIQLSQSTAPGHSQ